MIDMYLIGKIDQWLDLDVDNRYKEQPLAQDWARVAKIGEELGEATKELILWTGQNPRKGPPEPEAYERMLSELADTVITALVAIHHFTKDTSITHRVVRDRIDAVVERAGII